MRRRKRRARIRNPSELPFLDVDDPSTVTGETTCSRIAMDLDVPHVSFRSPASQLAAAIEQAASPGILMLHDLPIAAPLDDIAELFDSLRAPDGGGLPLATK